MGSLHVKNKTINLHRIFYGTLKENDADVNAKDNTGKTPLQYVEEALARPLDANANQWLKDRRANQEKALAWLKANGAE